MNETVTQSGEWSSAETAQAVLEYLARRSRAGLIKISMRSLAADMGFGRNTASSAIRRLRDTGRLEVARPGTGDRYPATYRIPALAGEPAA